MDDVEVAKDMQAGLAGSTGDLYIGAGKNLDAASFFSGLIDDVRICDRAIIPQAVQSLADWGNLVIDKTARTLKELAA